MLKNYNKLLNRLKRNLIIYICSFILAIIMFVIFAKVNNWHSMIFTVIIIIYTFIGLIRDIRLFRKFKQNVSTKVKKIIDGELNNILFEGTQYILTDNYIIDLARYLFINYQEILLIKKVKRFEGSKPASFCHRVYIVTKKGNYSFLSYCNIEVNGEKHFKYDLYEFLYKKNPNILKDDTSKNLEILLSKYNIKLDEKWLKKY